jgi:hypothetical protein
MRAAAAILLLVAATQAHAGGTAFACRYVSLESKGRDRFVLTLRALSEPDTTLTYTADGTVVLHIQWTERSPLRSGHQAVAHDDFLLAIDRIRRDLKAEEPTRFGILGNALFPLTRQPGHYRVYALRIEDEGPPGAGPERLVVYAE